MTKKPFFREFDQCWYAQLRLPGGKRKQVKLLDQIRGRENEAAAFQAFFRLMSREASAAPAPDALKVTQVCDLFLTAVCPYAGEAPETQPKKSDEQPPLKTNASHDVRTDWWYRKCLQSFCDFFGTLGALAVKPFHVTRWLDAHSQAIRKETSVFTRFSCYLSDT